ncbi:MAG: cytochrome c biogenesis protein ResB [Chloroflexi bacterium]|nr:cytochrome c biogenesis protein ResB [Chloroflexota bacterium]
MAQAEVAQGRERSARSLELLLALWRLVGSAQFALALIGFLSLAGLLAVVLPQIPETLRGNPPAIAAWVELQKGTFGPLTEPMRRLGLFSVVVAWWFLTALGLLAISVAVYMTDRLPSAWRNVTRPQQRVPDSYFDRAANRVVFMTAEATGEAEAASRLEALLSRRRFRVRTFREGDATYLFADRFAWAQLGTFASHVALIMFLAGGLLSWTGGYTNGLLIPEGTVQPVFPVSHPDQMLVEVVDAVGTFDAGGTPLDYRTELVIYQDGREVARGVTTVNGPLTYGGYRFHQAGYFGEGAALRVRDAATGNTLYREVLALRELWPAPVVTVRDAQGAVLLDDVIVPTEQLEGAWGTPITVPDSGRQFWVGVKQDEPEVWNLVVFGLADDETRFVAPVGEPRRTGDLQFTLVEVTGLPYTTTPSSTTPGIPGDNERSVVVMSESPDGTPYLTVQGAVAGYALTLYPDQPVQIGGKEYLFEGRREFAGIEVRRDPGAMFIWIAVGLLLAGLGITFYVPRLRLWARVRRQETVLAGLAEGSGSFRSETKQLARELGVRADESREEGDVDV